jgi:hypothetical protein
MDLLFRGRGEKKRVEEVPVAAAGEYVCLFWHNGKSSEPCNFSSTEGFGPGVVSGERNRLSFRKPLGRLGGGQAQSVHQFTP